ncbi:hypothetical protein [Gordonia sp. MMO-8]|uniref:hypothetical protein n=1 Tax=Gordonia sp. MMO-8 TaxID=3127886 RepID=UPI00301B644E
MGGPVSENGTPWNELPGATGGVRKAMTPRPKNPITLFTDLVKGIVRAIMGNWIPNEIIVIPGDVNPLQYLSHLMGIRWAQVDTIQEGVDDLKGRFDLMSPYEDRGSAYADGSGSIVNVGKVSFNNKIGESKGCDLINGGWLLYDAGSWRVLARVAPSFTIGGGSVGWEIRCFREDGSFYRAKRYENSNSGAHTTDLSGTFTVPGPNYRIEVWITDLIIGRATRGGSTLTELSVDHISRSIVNPGG